MLNIFINIFKALCHYRYCVICTHSSYDLKSRRQSTFDLRDGFPFLDGDVPRSASCGVCVSRLVRYAGSSGCVACFGTRNELLAQKLQNEIFCFHNPVSHMYSTMVHVLLFIYWPA